jgi:hypothetical protein
MPRPHERTTPHVIASRLAPDELRAVRLIAEARGETLSTFTRRAVAVMTNGGQLSIAQLAAEVATRRNLCAALRIPPESTDDQILHVVQAVLNADGGEILAPVNPVVPAASAPPVAAVALTNANVRALEESSRFGLVSELIRLGAETPATAWIGKAKDRKPVKRLADEPIVQLRARVASLRAAAPRAPTPLAPPVTTRPVPAVVLSAHEQATADAVKDPAKKAKFIELRTARAKART